VQKIELFVFVKLTIFNKSKRAPRNTW